MRFNSLQYSRRTTEGAIVIDSARVAGGWRAKHEAGAGYAAVKPYRGNVVAKRHARMHRADQPQCTGSSIHRQVCSLT